jgi:hypothetical protein
MPADISDYYQAQMLANARTAVSAEGSGDTFTLEHSKEGRTASLMIHINADSG